MAEKVKFMMNNNTMTAINVNFVMAESADRADLVLHPAPHHADDVFCAALLQLRYLTEYVTFSSAPLPIWRTRNAGEIEAAAKAHATIADVGGVYNPAEKRFDHHQNDAPVRPDGKKYAAFGQMWDDFGLVLLEGMFDVPQDVRIAAHKKVDQMLVRGIDLQDNGEAERPEMMTVSQVVSLCNPNWDEDPDDAQFLQACELAFIILERTIKSAISSALGVTTVQECIDKADAVMELPCFIGGWIEGVLTSENPKAKKILYGLFRNLQGQWSLRAIPTAVGLTDQRKPLPEAWRGRSAAELQEITGVEDAIFCHDGGFICGAKTREGALRLAELAVKA